MTVLLHHGFIMYARLWLIPLAPLVGFLVNGLFGRHLPKWLVTTVALLAPLASFLYVVVDGLALVTTVALKADAPFVETFGTWIDIGALHVDFSFVLDELSLVMLLVVTGVG